MTTPFVREGPATVMSMEEDLEVVGQATNGVEAVSLVSIVRFADGCIWSGISREVAR